MSIILCVEVSMHRVFASIADDNRHNFNRQ